MSSAKIIVDSFREVVQDLLVPELKSVKVSIDSLRSEMTISLDSLRSETTHSLDSLRSEMILRDDKLEQAMRLGFENNAAAIRRLSDKLDDTMAIRERLASLEARLPRQ